MKIKQNKLVNYCAIPAGVLVSAASVSGQTVIFYGVDAANDINSDPLGISFTNFNDTGFRVSSPTDALSYFAGGGTTADTNYVFTRGSDNITSLSSREGRYLDASSPNNNTQEFLYASIFLGTSIEANGDLDEGAIIGDQNYANISFDGDDGIFEAVGQFSFDGMGGGFLVAIAFADIVNEGVIIDPLNLSNIVAATSVDETFSISTGAAAIDAATAAMPVPEPSSVALLALGVTGLLMRRQRKVA